MYEIMMMDEKHQFQDATVDSPEEAVAVATAFFQKNRHGLVGRIRINGIPIRGIWDRYQLSKMEKQLCAG